MNIFAFTSNDTPVYTHPEAHPHLLNDDAKEAISKMVIPAAPADPTDRRQTRACETIDLGHKVGFCYRVARTPEMRCFKMRRANEETGELRSWFSVMTLDAEPTDETRITSVCFWDADNSCWVLWTNHTGAEDPWPEPGTERFERMNPEQQAEATAWHNNHVLVCNKYQRLQCLRTVTYQC